MLNSQYILPLHNELTVDLFAGGGGASTGIEKAIGRHVDIAINHDPEAIGLHAMNHPQTQHFCSDVFEIDPKEVTQGRPVGLLWASPDCKHFSKAKGGKPVEKRIRSLAWVVVRWARDVKPRMIFLENVEEFQTWGPLAADNRPCPDRKGRYFKRWIRSLKDLGYDVEWKELRACDYGAPTIRKRLFLIARCDGQPIVWPTPTHGDPKRPETKAKKLKPWRTAADIIDFSDLGTSIFERDRPLADNTLRRIAKGVMRYVVNAAEPFIVKVNHTGSGYDAFRGQSINDPLQTITAKHGYAVASPILVGAGGPVYSGKPTRVNQPIGTLVTENHKALASVFLTEFANASNQRNMSVDEPLRTQMAEVKGGHFAMCSAFMTKFNTGSVGYEIDTPAHTITAGGQQKRPGTAITQGIVAASMIHMRGMSPEHGVDEPIRTVTSGGGHSGLVAAFLTKFYGTDQDPRMDEPLHTITTKDRFGLVIVHIDGEPYVITDIYLRMLQPHELYLAQGFPPDYIIDNIVYLDGYKLHKKRLSKAAQVRMCGNSVCPPIAEAIVAVNYSPEPLRRAA